MYRRTAVLQYLIRRILQTIPTLFFLTVIAFTFISLAPGDVVDAMFTVDQDLSAEKLEAQREALGLNAPIPIQYLNWLSKVFQGDLGNSFLQRKSVVTLISERMASTALLGFLALLTATIIGLTAGLISGLKQYSIVDYIVSLLSYGAYSFPNFFLGMIMIYIFAVHLQWLPSAGIISPGEEPSLLGLIKHLILPVSVLATQFVGIFARQTRSAVLEVLNQDYVRTARAKGLHPMVVQLRHILPNALIPVITVIGLSLPLLITGAVVTEIVFSWTGIGQLTVDAILGRDYPVIMGIVLIVGVVVTSANLLVDLTYAIVDPRIRYNQE